MLELHYYPSNASFAPHLLLEEMQLPYTLRKVNREAGEHKSPAYLKLNPNGLIPVLIDNGEPLYETAAILMHLADKAPGFAPPMGTLARAHYLKWMVWMTNTLQAMLIHYFYPERMANEGDAQAAAVVKARAEAQVGPMLDQMEAELARHGGPWFGGAAYSALDPLAFMLSRWTRMHAHPARDRPLLGAYLARVAARPATQAVVAREGLPAPIY
ncbi:glutathione S-transferase family protein [Roseateles paludis]|jgi:glutathione S-transferase|uniref:Glutathione S-transferase family protein n=1 Tax=Roseateles paludis TaxID=3145238 RepID=A0ABV0FYG7_9BURK